MTPVFRPAPRQNKATVESRSALTSFPWDDAISSGLGVLRLTPTDFWSMTPRELGLALRGAAGLPGSSAPFSHADLCGLMQQFPDD